MTYNSITGKLDSDRFKSTLVLLTLCSLLPENILARTHRVRQCQELFHIERPLRLCCSTCQVKACAYVFISTHIQCQAACVPPSTRHIITQSSVQSRPGTAIWQRHTIVSFFSYIFMKAYLFTGDRALSLC